MPTFNELVEQLGRLPNDKEWRECKEAKDNFKRGKIITQKWQEHRKKTGQETL